MDNDTYKLFESYKAVYNEAMPYPEFAKLSKHAASKLPEDKPKEKLKYTYEIATANLPRDIDTSTKEGELKVLDLAYQELLKYFSKSKNPTLAARNTLNDEDMPGEIITQYNLYKRDGFPGEEKKDDSEFREQMPDSREEYSAHDYAKEMETKGEQEEDDDDSMALVVRGNVYDLGNGYSILITKESEPDRYSYDIDILKNVDPKNSKYIYMTQIHRLGEIGIRIGNWASSSEPQIKQKAIDALKKYGASIPDINHEDEERRLDPKCWKGYHKAGTKLKSGVRVNKCVKNS